MNDGRFFYVRDFQASNLSISDDLLVYRLLPSLALDPNTGGVTFINHRDYGLSVIKEIGFTHSLPIRYLRSDVLKMRKRIRSFRRQSDQGQPGGMATFEAFRTDTAERMRDVMQVIISYTP